MYKYHIKVDFNLFKSNLRHIYHSYYLFYSIFYSLLSTLIPGIEVSNMTLFLCLLIFTRAIFRSFWCWELKGFGNIIYRDLTTNLYLLSGNIAADSSSTHFCNRVLIKICLLSWSHVKRRSHSSRNTVSFINEAPLRSFISV